MPSPLTPALALLVLALTSATSALSPSELELDVRPSAAAPVTPRPFVAAVSEFVWADGYPERDLAAEPDAPWRRNLETVRRHAATAAQQGADLLVLAEYAILKVWPRAQLAVYAAQLPPVEDMVVICDDPTQHEAIRNLSCLAREHQMYIVANFVTKELCSADSDSACPEDGVSLYNTNLVFDRTGALIQIYHKYNLFGIELEHLQKPAPHLSAFRTDFGAVIGLMTCFDILFELPGVEMTRRGVTHFAFPTDWGDELPSLSALQMHSAWPRGLGVTLLSSGIHYLAEGSIGSGIFTGSGALGYLYDYSAEGAEGGVVTATVPAGCSWGADSCPSDQAPAGRQVRSAPAAGNTDDYYPIQNYNVSEFVSAPLSGRSQRLCDGEFCCDLTVSQQRPVTGAESGATYRLLVLDGRRNFAPHWSTQICAVVLCAGADQASCSTFPAGVAPPPPAPFSLRGSFSADWAVFPSVIRTHMELAAEWFYSRPTGQLEVADTGRLLVAQLYGRNYALDQP
ncbi:biotinidase-like [Amphibalanus amphitrite]|uniref:biotinidase-like n=1 Tax=Amphibalanus amphitrite TaxID=1232801 RepID=UPI001C913295|nr:biotinidase-like [Amphibalanus amphitrite]